MRPSLWLSVAVAVALVPQVAGAARVGTTAAVNPQATGTPPGGETRTLFVGSDIVFEERIVTTAAGQTQILFVDQSSLTVGPNAEVVIDRFVYDPDRTTGELVVSVTKGVFRFVGGKISASNGATIRTPTATLGIRGSVVLGSADPLDVVFVAGQDLTVENAAGTLNFDARSVGRRIVTEGGAPRDAGRASADALRGFMTALHTDGTGGAPETPTTGRAGAGLGSRLPGDGLLVHGIGNLAARSAGSILAPGKGSGDDEIRDAVQTGQTDQIRDVIGDDGPGGGIDDLFGGLPPVPGGTPGPRTTGNLEGYGTSLSFRYDGTTDPLQFLTEGTDLYGRIVAAGGPTPTLAIERSVEGDHVDATLDLDRVYEFGNGFTSNSLFHDDRTFAAILPPSEPGGPRTIMLTNNLLSDVAGIDRSKLCNCDFLTWGYWAADAPVSSDSETPGTERDLVALGTWVAGVLPGADEIPTAGSASYAGHMVGSVSDNGQFRMATGSMTGNFDFGSRSGDMRIEDFDNRDYTGAVDGFSNRLNFGLSSTDQQVHGNMVGSFAKNGSDPVGGIIGDVILSGGDAYSAVGTVAGERVPGNVAN